VPPRPPPKPKQQWLAALQSIGTFLGKLRFYHGCLLFVVGIGSCLTYSWYFYARTEPVPVTVEALQWTKSWTPTERATRTIEGWESEIRHRCKGFPSTGFRKRTVDGKEESWASCDEDYWKVVGRAVVSERSDGTEPPDLELPRRDPGHGEDYSRQNTQRFELVTAQKRHYSYSTSSLVRDCPPRARCIAGINKQQEVHSLSPSP
jgi:hypothetical protein